MKRKLWLLKKSYPLLFLFIFISQSAHWNGVIHTLMLPCLDGKVTGEFKEVSQAENQANCIWAKSNLISNELVISLQWSLLLRAEATLANEKLSWNKGCLQKTENCCFWNVKCPSDIHIYRIYKSKVTAKVCRDNLNVLC